MINNEPQKERKINCVPQGHNGDSILFPTKSDFRGMGRLTKNNERHDNCLPGCDKSVFPVL